MSPADKILICFLLLRHRFFYTIQLKKRPFKIINYVACLINVQNLDTSVIWCKYTHILR